MPENILDIKDVPHSPNTSLTPIYVKNPTDQDFTHTWDGKPYTIPAKSKKAFPEFLGYHLAKHLAQAIVIPAFVEELRAEAEKAPTEQVKNQILNRSVPPERLVNKQKELIEDSSLTQAEPLDTPPAETPAPQAPVQDDTPETGDLEPEDSDALDDDKLEPESSEEPKQEATQETAPETPNLTGPAAPEAATPGPVTAPASAQ